MHHLCLVELFQIGSLTGLGPPMLSFRVSRIFLSMIFHVNGCLIGAFLTGAVLLCNLAVKSEAGIICTAVFIGFFSGIFIATPPLLFVSLTKDKSKIGTRMGMAFALLGTGVLAGGPGSGGVLQRNTHSLDWTGTWTYGGVFTLGSGVCFLIMRIWLAGFKIQKI